MFVQSLSFQAVILWAFPLLFLTLVLKNILAECSVDAGYIRLWADRYDNTIIFSIGESIFREFTLTLPGAASSFSFWPAELASKKPFSKVLYGIVTVYTSTGELVSDCYTCLLINGLEITATMDSKTQVTLSFAWKNNPYLNGLNKKNLPQLLTPFSSYSERENSWQVTFPGIGHVLAASWKFRKCDLILQVSVEGPHPMPGLNGSTLGCR